MTHFESAARFGRAGSKTKRGPFALEYASWHAHLAGRRLLDLPTPVAPARAVQLDYTALFARLAGVDRKAA